MVYILFCFAFVFAPSSWIHFWVFMLGFNISHITSVIRECWGSNSGLCQETGSLGGKFSLLSGMANQGMQGRVSLPSCLKVARGMFYFTLASSKRSIKNCIYIYIFSRFAMNEAGKIGQIKWVRTLRRFCFASVFFSTWGDLVSNHSAVLTILRLTIHSLSLTSNPFAPVGVLNHSKQRSQFHEMLLGIMFDNLLICLFQACVCWDDEPFRAP